MPLRDDSWKKNNDRFTLPDSRWACWQVIDWNKDGTKDIVYQLGSKKYLYAAHQLRSGASSE